MSPTYTYRCATCGAQAEIVHSITSEDPRQCPKCKRPMIRLITGGGGILFKGRGWAKDGYSTPPPDRKKR